MKVRYLENHKIIGEFEVQDSKVVSGEPPSYLTKIIKLGTIRETLEDDLERYSAGMGNQSRMRDGKGAIAIVDEGSDDRTDAEEEPDIADLLTEKASAEMGEVFEEWVDRLQSWVNGVVFLEAARKTLLDSPGVVYEKLDGQKFSDRLAEYLILADLAGRDEVLTEGERFDAKPSWLRLGFKEAIAYFRRKLTIPVKDYRKLDKGWHDYAFSIQGVTRADVLDSARFLVDEAIAEGTSLDDFKSQWSRLITRKGWAVGQSRVETIFDTNIRGAYGAGRWQQMTDPSVLSDRPYLIWRHRDSPDFRPEHKKLHNVAIAANDPFWQGLRVPSGFGCRCGVFSASEAYCKRNNIKIEKNPPDPDIIADPGFRTPFDVVLTRQQIVADKLTSLPPKLRAIVQKQLKGSQ